MSSLNTKLRSLITDSVLPFNATERVARGAAELDRLDPDWYKRVDTETLQLNCPRKKCILAQIFGSYDEGWRKLNRPTGAYMRARGFNGGGHHEYRALAIAWKRAILARRTAQR